MAFPTGWTSAALDIVHGKVAANQTNFRTLVTAANLPSAMLTLGGAGAAQSDGGDIRFTSDLAGAVRLPVDLVGWTLNANPALSVAEIWTLTAPTSGSDARFYVWWIGSGQSQPAANAAFGSQAVWATTDVSIWHLKDGSTLNLGDATASAITLTNNNVVTATAGKIDGGALLSSTGPKYLDGGTTSVLAPSQITIACWIKATSFPNAYQSVVTREKSSVIPSGYSCMIKSTGKLALYFRIGIGGSDIHYDGTGTNTLVTGTWYYFVATYGVVGSTVTLTGYINGAQDGQATFVSNEGMIADPVTFYVGNSGIASRFWNGAIDELQISNVARSATWISTAYNNQNDPATFIVAGTPVPPAGGGASNFVIT